jgi:hypothetical protein
MDLKCEDIWAGISDYLDGDLEPLQHLAMTEHIGQCKSCQAVLEGVRNVVSLYGNENLFAPAPGFQRRLRSWLTERVEGPKGSWWGWVAAVGLTAALAASLFLAVVRDHSNPLRAPMSDPARQTPQQLVAVVEAGKLFHQPGCPVIHGKFRLVTPEEALREGYTPCPRCLGEDLRTVEQVTKPVEVGENRDSLGMKESPKR